MAESQNQGVPDPPPPPRAFTQGVGTVFQVAGVFMFLALSTICCGSSVMGKEGERPDLANIGWHIGGAVYSVPRAMSVGLIVGLALASAVAALGLGMQALHRSAAFVAAGVAMIGVVFWGVHLAFAITGAGSIVLTLLALVLLGIYGALSALGVGAAREMLANPPAKGHDILPPGYKVPYSWYHDDPPEVRLAAELEQRKRRLAVQQKELEMLEEKVRRGKEEGGG
jgi:hypothetical protein